MSERVPVWSAVTSCMLRVVPPAPEWRSGALLSPTVQVPLGDMKVAHAQALKDLTAVT